MTSKTIHDIYQESETFPLEEEIISQLGPASLEPLTLKFIGTYIKRMKPSHIFEFGSGISTSFISTQLADNKSAKIFTVDHSLRYLQKTQSICRGKNNIEYFLCPIKPYFFKTKAFLSYRRNYYSGLSDRTKLDFVLIDGPSGRRFGREAVLYQIAPWLISETIIFLHDANRPTEQTALGNWQKIWANNLNILLRSKSGNGFVVMKIDDPILTGSNPFSFREIVTSWYIFIKSNTSNSKEKSIRIR